MSPAARRRCDHCGEWIYRTGREWTHEHRDNPACIVESRYTGTHAEPARRSAMPERIQRKRTAGWRMPEGAVYVGRPTRYGNQFTIRRVDCDLMGGGMCWLVTDGRIARRHLDTKRHAAEVAVELYRLHTGPMGRYEIEDGDLAALRGHDLVCWCPLDQPCHADVLLEWANQPREA